MKSISTLYRVLGGEGAELSVKARSGIAVLSRVVREASLST